MSDVPSKDVHFRHVPFHKLFWKWKNSWVFHIIPLLNSLNSLFLMKMGYMIVTDHLSIKLKISHVRFPFTVRYVLSKFLFFDINKFKFCGYTQCVDQLQTYWEYILFHDVAHCRNQFRPGTNSIQFRNSCILEVTRLMR